MFLFLMNDPGIYIRVLKKWDSLFDINLQDFHDRSKYIFYKTSLGIMDERKSENIVQVIDIRLTNLTTSNFF